VPSRPLGTTQHKHGYMAGSNIAVPTLSRARYIHHTSNSSLTSAICSFLLAETRLAKKMLAEKKAAHVTGGETAAARSEHCQPVAMIPASSRPALAAPVLVLVPLLEWLHLNVRVIVALAPRLTSVKRATHCLHCGQPTCESHPRCHQRSGARGPPARRRTCRTSAEGNEQKQRAKHSATVR